MLLNGVRVIKLIRDHLLQNKISFKVFNFEKTENVSIKVYFLLFIKIKNILKVVKKLLMFD